MILVAVLCVNSTVALGYSYRATSSGTPYTWATDTITLRPSSSGFPSGSKWRNALNSASAAWNHNPSKLQFSIGTSTTGTGKNGDNNVYLVDSSYLSDWYGLFGAPNPAMCITWYKSGKLIEADIWFNLYYSWTDSTVSSNLQAYTGTKRSIQATAIHEMGHALGLGHESRTYNCMGYDQNHVTHNGSTVRFYPGEDAGNGAVFLYGLASPRREDVSVTHWKYKGTYGEYSTHTRSNMWAADDTPLPQWTGTSGDPVFEVSRGDTVKLELTYENNGATTQSVQVHYYLETNPLFRTRLLATRTMGLARNTVYTTKQTVVIPSDMSRGFTYYLVAVVDPSDTIAEVREDNNSTYVRVYIR